MSALDADDIAGTADAADWAALNQTLLSAELARLLQRLESPDDDVDLAALDAAVEEAHAAMPAPSALDIVAQSFGFSPFERDVLLLCCGVELDSRIGAACARLNGSSAQRNATFGLALSRLPEPHWSALTPELPLRHWRMVEIEPGPRLVDSPLRIDERILHFVTGINQVDSRLRPMLTGPIYPPRLMTPEHLHLADGIAETMYRELDASNLVVLDGDDAHGQADVAAGVAARLGQSLWAMSAEDLPGTAAELDQLRLLWDREARLAPVLLRMECRASTAQLTQRFIAQLRAPCFIVSSESFDPERPARRYTVNKPAPCEQKGLWMEALGERASALNGSVDRLATQFRLSARSIESASSSTAALDPAAGLERALWCTVRARGRERLDALAQRIEGSARWDDLVLPPAQKDTLRQIAGHVRQRNRVFHDWGFARLGARGLGTSALFSGESGTGKTLAAEVLARELDLDLYRIDLASVVSKYIGETEKNLRRVFDAAENSGAMLLFYEADALFGKRSDVKDSHDRFANIEVSYLLQRMEAYSGLAILTTNMKSSLDRAFHRRLRFIVNFPFPDLALREEVWRRVFPAATPLARIDYTKLARLNLPGGSIRNIAVNAAFLAAEAGEPVAMCHLRSAAQSESAKLDRPLSDGEVRGWM
jgi:hypothetical protein